MPSPAVSIYLSNSDTSESNVFLNISNTMDSFSKQPIFMISATHS